MSNPQKHTDPVMNGSICPYCKKPTVYTDSSEIYGKSYGMIYICRPCNAYVGVHQGTDIALGRLANSGLRYLKKLAHKYFDDLWGTGQMRRRQAYRWLSERMGIPVKDTHIGMFDEKQCEQAIDHCKQLLTKLTNEREIIDILNDMNKDWAFDDLIVRLSPHDPGAQITAIFKVEGAWQVTISGKTQPLEELDSEKQREIITTIYQRLKIRQIENR